VWFGERVQYVGVRNACPRGFGGTVSGVHCAADYDILTP